MDAEWLTFPLYDLAHWRNGLAFRDFQFSGAGKPVIKIAELKDGVTDQTKFTQQTFDPTFAVELGDMLFSWSGNPDTSIDVFWWRRQSGWLNQHIFKVTPRAEVDHTYFYYVLKSLKPTFAEIARNKQTTGLGHVTVKDLQAIEVAVPDMPEQRALAHTLGALDDKIELNRRINETLEEMAQTLFRSWFVDFEPVKAKTEGRAPEGMDAETAALFPAAFQESEIGEIPAGWTVCSVSQAMEVNPTRSLRKGEVAPYLDMGNMPTCSARALAVYEREFGSGMRFQNGDTLLARITPCLENGKTAYVDFLADGQFGWGSTEYIVLRPKAPLPTEYAYFLARTPEFRSFAIANMTGSSGRQRVPADCLDNYKIAVPTPQIAEQFGLFARQVFEQMKVSDDQSATVAAMRDELLPKLIAGQVRLPADMVAEFAAAKGPQSKRAA